jgi:hypothetical protein
MRKVAVGKSVALIAGLALAAVPAAALAGGGDEASVSGVVKIRNHAAAFHGRVLAENGSCNGPRPVKLWSRDADGDRVLLGTTMADIDGKWLVAVDPLASGEYLAVAPRFELDDGGIPFDCLRAKSRTLAVD